MKIRDILATAGAFCTSFGAVLVASGKSEAAWWTGTAMVILGPLLMGSRAMVSAKKGANLPPINQPPASQNPRHDG